MDQGLASADDLAGIGEAIKADAEEAVKYALDAAYPDVSEVDMHVFTDVKHALEHTGGPHT